ncbi:hypothetical protein VTN77DRAFT_4346 [Rasamsonia byssochlamydoides]|uniref:uncharacterized protein n=1 Tax=Rasamsonia byssochlamydoides TaxID=89139 RepID=UPI003742BF6A
MQLPVRHQLHGIASIYNLQLIPQGYTAGCPTLFTTGHYWFFIQHAVNAAHRQFVQKQHIFGLRDLGLLLAMAKTKNKAICHVHQVPATWLRGRTRCAVKIEQPWFSPSLLLQSPGTCSPINQL